VPGVHPAKVLMKPLPAPWSVEELDACLFRGRAGPALSREATDADEARRIAANIAMLSELLPC
jgi:hypothetical protein